jgi:hypothetical protein
MITITDAGKKRIVSTRLILTPTIEASALKRIQPTQDLPLATLDRRVNNLQSLMGQMSKDMKEMKETLAMVKNSENCQPNRRNHGAQGDGKSTKEQGPANQKPEHFANKAKTGRAAKKATTGGNPSSSDEVE